MDLIREGEAECAPKFDEEMNTVLFHSKYHLKPIITTEATSVKSGPCSDEMTDCCIMMHQPMVTIVSTSRTLDPTVT
jgi:hypothetical protein